MDFGNIKEKRMMNRTSKAVFVVALTATLFVVSGPGFGQEKGGVGYFTTGVGWFLESGSNSIVYSAGGGGHSITNRWILGGEGHSSFGPDNAGGYGFFNLGYVLLNKDFILAYPLVGLGGGAMTSTIDSSVSKCALLSPAVAVDLLIRTKDNSGALVGIHAGYTFTVYSTTFTWSMPYMRLVIGGYGFGK
jgi:hypothetical protein